MMICPTCNQPIKESVLVGRKLIAQVHSGAKIPSGTGRYLTIMSLACGCGTRTERRYENRQLAASVTHG